MGDGGELECALDDVFGIWVTVRSCCEKRIETKLCKSRLNSPTIAEEFENKFGQVVEKLSDVILCFFGFVKAKLEIRANIRIAFKMFWQRVASLVKFYTNQKVFSLSGERPKYEFSATV